MMEEFITPVRIANSILLKSNFKGTYLIVEGNNDFTLYSKFVNHEFCQVEIAFGNSNVIDVINELEKRGFREAIGLIDADFRLLDNDMPLNKSVFLTDLHDLDLMIFMSDAFETVIGHYSNPLKVEAFKKENINKDLRDIFLNLALPLGCLKRANRANNLGLAFKPLTLDGNPLSIAEFVPPSTLKFSGYEIMIETVINYSRNKTKINTTVANAINKVKKILEEHLNIHQLCNGHDVISIVCISLRKKIATMNSNALKPEQLEKDLIFAYDSRHFEKTLLYQQIKTWEKLNAKPVLKF